MVATSGATHLHTAIAGLFDAIRSKASVSGSMTFSAAMSAVESIGGGGDGTFALELVEGTFSSIPSAIANSLSTIGPMALVGGNLTEVNLPACTSIASQGFYEDKTITTINFPNCIYIGQYAFYSCSNLITANFSNCTTIENSAFEYCYKLQTISFPNCTSLGGWAFATCSKITTVNLPKCSILTAGAFYNCSNLTTATFSSCRSIQNYVFQYCSKLMSLYLTGPYLVTLSHVNALSYSPLSLGGSGKIYVPASLWTTYKTASMWINVSNKIISV